MERSTSSQPTILHARQTMKRLAEGNFRTAWGGIASFSMALPVMYTEASNRGFTLTDIARWMAEAPAKLAGCDQRKGRIAAGYDADFVVFDPEAEFMVSRKGCITGIQFRRTWAKSSRPGESNLSERETGLHGRQISRRSSAGNIAVAPSA